MSYLVKAIRSLCPTAEFSFIEEDYSTVQFDVLEGNAPTEAEITKEIAKIKSNEAKQIQDNAEAKSALLARLGITAEEAALLLG